MTSNSYPLRTPRRLRLAEAAASALCPGTYVRLSYPPAATNRPRYGYGRPPHGRLRRILAQHHDTYRETLTTINQFESDLLKIPVDQTDPLEPHWTSGYLFGLDAPSLYAFARTGTPRRYLEIGSGMSTLFVDRARRDAALSTEIISIDPAPRREIDTICDSVIRRPLEEVPMSVFDQVETGDIVFMDGTHRVFMNSDATAFFLDVLPSLPPGVRVGVHDIHLPDDYRPEQGSEYYSEQYLLAALLLGEPAWLRPTLPCWYVASSPDLAPHAQALFGPGKLDFLDTRGVTFWMTTQ